MQNIKYENGRLYLLDQTLLPNEEKYIEPKTKEDYYSYLRTYKKKYNIQAKYIHYTITKDKKFFDFNSVKVIKIVEDEKGVENDE